MKPRTLRSPLTLNPECEHLPGDMRHVRLGRTFDGVFVHDAVDYMTTEDDLRAALRTAVVHLAPGGVALVAPDVTAETFEVGTEHGGGEDGRGRAARYLQWTLPPGPGGTSYAVLYAFLLREPDGSARRPRRPPLRGVRARHVAASLPESGTGRLANPSHDRGRRVRLVRRAAWRALGALGWPRMANRDRSRRSY